jgi:hypothetical protein
MATDKQIAANRRNAQKSTGPRTAAGKFRSSLNALRHGLYARRFVLFTEDESAFRQFSREMVDLNQPANANELELVETMIHAAWRRRRLSEIIQARINEAVHQAIAQHPESATDGVRLTQLASAHLEASSPSLLRQEAHEFRLAAIFERSLSRLHSLRRAEAREKLRFEANLANPLFAPNP